MLGSYPELGYEVVGLVGRRPDVPGGRPAQRPGPRSRTWAAREVLELVRATSASGVIVRHHRHRPGVGQPPHPGPHPGGALRRALLGHAGHLIRRVIGAAPRPLPHRCASSRWPPSGWRAPSKRAFDVVAAAIALLVARPGPARRRPSPSASPPAPGCSSARTRVGRDGVAVHRVQAADHGGRRRGACSPSCMAQNEAAGPMFKMSDDPRVTRVGRFLRKTVHRRAAPAASTCSWAT